MKKNVWLILTAALATGALAQQVTNPPPAALAPAPATSVSATAATPAPTAATAKAEKKASAKHAKKTAHATARPALQEKPVFLSPGPAKITGNNVNVRGQAALVGEIITRLNTGDSVTVIEQVIREKPKAGEPAQWAKIDFPTNSHVWVHASYVDTTNKVVLPKKLNVRAGPGENYSVVGVIEHGTPVKEFSAKGDWIEIESPTGAYAFVAAMYLKQEGAPAAVPPIVSIAPPETEPPPTTAVVPEPTPVATTTTETPAPAPAATTAPAPEPEPAAPAAAPAAETAPAPPAVEEPPPRRIVQHEGVVKGTWSIQAPTKFALVDPQSGKTVNYLYTTSTNLDLSLWKGHRIIVTGEEGLDERWKNTPIITIQRIQVVE